MSERILKLRPSDWGELRLKAAVAVAVLSIAIGTLALAIGVHNETRIVHDEARVTKVEKTACAKNPVEPNKRCEEIRQELSLNESIVSACIAHQRVTGDRGRNCTRFYVDTGQNGSVEPPNFVPHPGTRNGGDASTGTNTQHSQPGPSGGRSTESHVPAATERSNTTTTTERSTETTRETVSPEPANPSPKEPVKEAAGGVVESAGATVEEVGSAATETVREVICTLADPLPCP